MPRVTTLTETAQPIDDDATGPRLGFYLLQKSPTFDTLVKRLRCDVVLECARSDGTRFQECLTYRIYDPPAIESPGLFTSGDAAALRGLLLKLWNSAIAARGL